MFDRYARTRQITNNNRLYRYLFKDKRLPFIKQYETYDFRKLRDIDQLNINFVEHTIAPFDRLDNISYKYYGSPEFGWLICYTNKLGSEFDLEEGMVLKIYLPLNSLLGLF